MGSVLIVGSISVDFTTYLDRWPEIGETIKAVSAQVNTGGKGANQACAAANLGATSYFLGATGHDAYAGQVIDDLENHGVNCLVISDQQVPTGMAFIDVGPDGNNMIRIAAGSNGTLTPDKIDAIWQDNQIECSVLLLQNEIPIDVSLHANSLAQARGALTIMDPAPAPSPLWEKDIFSQFDVVTPNEQEAANILNRDINTLIEAQEAAIDLAKITRRGAIVTMGAHGAAWVFDGEKGTMQAPKVHVVDTVAAGDCFNGALAASLALGKTFAQAIHFASHAASLATTQKGALPSLPSLSQVVEFIGSS